MTSGLGPLVQEAIALFAADPLGFGGIALHGPAGKLRERVLGELTAALGRPVRRLPLHITDENLLGGLDVGATLAAGRPVQRVGLLAAAEGGVLIVPMAERMEPRLAAHLGAALDLGGVAVVALDESEAEGERLVPALAERLGFHLDLSIEAALPEMAEAASPPPDPVLFLCQGALQLGVESARPVVFALRAARVRAALHGRAAPDMQDLLVAAALVIAPRATILPTADAPPQELPDPPPDESRAEDAAPDSPPPDTPPPEEPPAEQPRPEQGAGEMIVEAAKAVLPAALLAQLSQLAGPSRSARAGGAKGPMRRASQRGRPIGARAGELRGQARLHLLETLRAAAPWQRLRTPAAAGLLAIRREDIRVVRFRAPTRTTTIIAVDASGSAALNRLAEAKGAVELLLAECYIRRDQVALIGFRNDTAELLLPPTGSLSRAKRLLAGLPGGGATPLAAGIDAICDLAREEARKGRTPLLALLTDGRTNVARDGRRERPAAEADALAAARAAAAAGYSAIVLDISPRPNAFLRQVATAMQARYLPLPFGDASAVSRAVRAAA